MPIIMPLAFSTNQKKIISAKEYNQDRKDKMLCEDSTCRIDVAYVRRYERQYGDKKINVEAFFRLKSKNFKHNEECKYNINTQIKIIASKSNSSIIKSIEEGYYKFRISLVYSEFIICGSKGAPTLNPKNPIGKNLKGVKYVHSGEISPYISTMKKVIELRTKLVGNDELKKHIILEIKNHDSNKTEEINWDKFYFTVSNYKNMYNYIASHRCNHITCIEGVIKEFHEPSAKFPFHSIRLNSPSIKRKDLNNIEVPTLQLVLENKEIYKFIKENSTTNSRIATFAIFVTPGNKFNELKKVEYLNIRGNISTRSQIIIF